MRKAGVILAVLILGVGGVLAFVAFAGIGLSRGPAQALCQPGAAVTTVSSVPEGLEVAGYSGAQLDVALKIIAEGARKGFDAHGQTIGVMTSMGESGLGAKPSNPKSSAAGPFHQLDNGAWGTYEQRMDPTHSAGKFFDVLAGVTGWRTMEPTRAAHAVQRNEDPLHYAKYWESAVAVVTALSAGQPAPTQAPSSGGGDTISTVPAWASSGQKRYELGAVKPHTQALAEEVGARFGLKPGEIGGYRANAIDRNGHPAGLALDLMTYEDTALGDAIAAYLQANAARLSVDYIIWKQAIWHADEPDKGWVRMADRGSTTANHMDHPHVNVTPTPSAESAAGLSVVDCLATSVAAPGGVPTGQWVAPLDAPITSPYGPRWGSFHEGTDLGAPCGTPIYAAGDGVVTYTGRGSREFSLTGHVIVVDHGGGIETTYNHMYANGVLVRVGQQVAAGDLIAEVGNDGNSTGCHLHFGTHINGQHTNAVPFMSQRGVTLGA